MADEQPQLAVNGTTVAIVWKQNTNSSPIGWTISVRTSTDGGVTFGSIVNLSAPLAQPNGALPRVAISGSNVHVAWHEGTDFLYRASADSGSTFGAIQALNGTSPVPNGTSALVASGSNVYAAFPVVISQTPTGWGNTYGMILRSSTDNGTTFAGPVNLTSFTPSGSAQAWPAIAAEGSEIDVAWEDRIDPHNGCINGCIISFRHSSDSGATWDPPLDQDATTVSGSSQSGAMPTVALGDAAVYVIWFDNTLGNNEIFFRRAATTPTNPPALSISPSSLDFGVILVGTSKDLTFTVTNTGGGTLTGSASASIPFSIVPPDSFSLTAGQSQNITVRFSPTSAGTFTSNVSVTSNGGSASPQVQGVGALPHIDSLSDPTGTLTITSNPVGSLVSIKGSYFDTNATNHVQLCATTPTITHWEDTLIVFVVPSLAAGTVCQLQVVAPAGSSNAVSLTVVAPLSISGLIRTSAGRGIAGVRVSIAGDKVGIATTTRTGAYSQIGLPNGIFTLTPVLSGYDFTPSTQQVTLNGASAANVNFTGTLEVPVISSVSPSTGSTVQTVTITGTGFAQQAPSGNAVFFGSANASITSWSPTRIIVKAPSGSGSVLVTVQTGVGTDHQQTSNAKAFNYTAPLPTNVNIVPSGDFQALIFRTFQITQRTRSQAVATISIQNNTQTWYVVYPEPPIHVTAEPPLPTQPFLMSAQQELPLGEVTFTRPNPMQIAFVADNSIDLTTCNTPTAMATSACDQTRFVLAALGWDLFYRVITGNAPLPTDTPSITGLLLALGAQNPLINLAINTYNKDLLGIIEQLQDAIYDDAVKAIITKLNLPTELPGWWDFYWRAGFASELLVETLIYPHTGTLTFTGR
ncbi:MAG: IPT/TIG domain-containing protein [candidate division NC10 bacterium]|nr:IPT/TIG domain-containing protein [candidate division NC10 bacterium]MDE2320590.1 IPT/TIG domain-containing protein [candidate division NC10 bacterium]